MDFNEYWVVEALNYRDKWAPLNYDPIHLDFEAALGRIRDFQFSVDFTARIVHYTGTGAEVVAEWDAEGKRVK